MSDGGRERASLEVMVWKSSQMWSGEQSAVRSIAWLDVSPVKRFGTVIASATENLSTELTFCLANPVSPRSLKTRVALAAPRIWAQIVWVYRGEEPHTATITKSFDDVLTYKRLRLEAVFGAISARYRFRHSTVRNI